MDNTKLSQPNMFVQSVSELAEALQSNNVPSNRIFDTILTQMKELNEAIHARRGTRPNIEDLEMLEERMNVLDSLADVYLSNPTETTDDMELKEAQIETVRRTKDFVEEYQGIVRQYKAVLQRNEEAVGKEKNGLAYEKQTSITERSDFVRELIHKGSESAVLSLKMMEEIADKEDKELTEQDLKTIRYAMASASMIERILLGGEEVQNLRTSVRRSGEYENLISLVAESKEFRDLTAPICNSKGVEVFLKDENSGRKLWQKFEGKVRENNNPDKSKQLGNTKSKEKKKELKQDKELKQEKELKREKELKKEQKKELKPRGPQM